MARTSSHIIETKSKDYIRRKINSFYETGDALFRELTERDYGIDGLIELFEKGKPTGQIALVQIKGTEKAIVPLKSKDVVSCEISSSNAEYALQNNVPIVLLYATISKEEGFYYVDINKALTEEHRKKIKQQKEITVHIPILNNAMEDLEPLFEIIRNFYKERQCLK